MHHWVLDMGYYFSLLLLLVYFVFIKRRANTLNKGKLSIVGFMPMVLLLQIAVTGIFGSALCYIGWHVVLCGYVFLNIYSRQKYTKRLRSF